VESASAVPEVEAVMPAVMPAVESAVEPAAITSAEIEELPELISLPLVMECDEDVVTPNGDEPPCVVSDAPRIQVIKVMPVWLNPIEYAEVTRIVMKFAIEEETTNEEPEDEEPYTPYVPPVFSTELHTLFDI